MNTTELHIGKRIAAIRAHRRMSQAELAAALHITRNTIHRWEHGLIAVKLPRVPEIARALHCRAADLLAPTDAPLPRVTFRGGKPESAMIHELQRLNGYLYVDDGT